MALFKISSGNEEDLPNTLTKGYAYFTEDDGNLYIDIDNGLYSTSPEKRIQVGGKAIDNAKSKMYHIILLANEWIALATESEELGYTQTVLIEGLSGEIAPIINCLDNEKEYNLITKAIADKNQIIFIAKRKPADNISLIIIDLK